jgi:hypothetical protein
VQLQRSLPDLTKRGLGLAAISYDAPATLSAFAESRGITFPLLSDAGSDVIARFDILNREATGRTAGIPYPGTFVLDARGVVTARSFEERYQERASADSVLLLSGAAGQSPPAPAGILPLETRHLILRTGISDRVASPGTRISLRLDVEPKPKMHVYTPEQKDLIPISLVLDPNDALRVHPPKYPNSEKYYFAPLQQTQLVYSKPFRIVQDVTIALTAAVRDRASKREPLTIAGRLRYQACDDKVCYMPQEIPVSWTIELAPIER